MDSAQTGKMCSMVGKPSSENGKEVQAPGGKNMHRECDKSHHKPLNEAQLPRSSIEVDEFTSIDLSSVFWQTFYGEDQQPASRIDMLDLALGGYERAEQISRTTLFNCYSFGLLLEWLLSRHVSHLVGFKKNWMLKALGTGQVTGFIPRHASQASLQAQSRSAQRENRLYDLQVINPLYPAFNGVSRQLYSCSTSLLTILHNAYACFLSRFVPCNYFTHASTCFSSHSHFSAAVLREFTASRLLMQFLHPESDVSNVMKQNRRVFDVLAPDENAMATQRPRKPPTAQGMTSNLFLLWLHLFYTI